MAESITHSRQCDTPANLRTPASGHFTAECTKRHPALPHVVLARPAVDALPAKGFTRWLCIMTDPQGVVVGTVLIDSTRDSHPRPINKAGTEMLIGVEAQMFEEAFGVTHQQWWDNTITRIEVARCEGNASNNASQFPPWGRGNPYSGCQGS